LKYYNITMNDHLGKVSVLLLLFYLGWFAWDQRGLIHDQQREIQKLEQQLIFQSIVINATLQEDNEVLNKQKYNTPQKYFKF
jgi:hypothetical protein